MTFSTLEILALVVAVATLLKLLVIFIEPKKWMKVIDVVYQKPYVSTIISLILAGLILNYLLEVGFTIVEIFAVMAFLALLMVGSVASYFGELRKIASKMLNNRNLLRRAWLPILIWAILSLWVLYELLI